MRILAVIQGEYGRRIARNVHQHAPEWSVSVWEAPDISLEEAMDEPNRFIPSELPPADLILCLGESPAVAVLLPELVQATGARAVIAPIDHEQWLPQGLAGQVRQWLAAKGISSVFPKPFCSLTEHSAGLRSYMETYQNPLIAEFAQRFGRPELQIQIGADGKTIQTVEVLRDSPCGCARYVAQRLAGVSVDEAVMQTGLFHHQFPCLASMCRMDPVFNDTLMHVAGDILREQVGEQVAPLCTPPVYLRPSEHVETPRVSDSS